MWRYELPWVFASNLAMTKNLKRKLLKLNFRSVRREGTNAWSECSENAPSTFPTSIVLASLARNLHKGKKINLWPKDRKEGTTTRKMQPIEFSEYSMSCPSTGCPLQQVALSAYNDLAYLTSWPLTSRPLTNWLWTSWSDPQQHTYSASLEIILLRHWHDPS